MQLHLSQPEQKDEGHKELHACLFGSKEKNKVPVHLFSAQQRLDPSLPLKRNATAAGLGFNALMTHFGQEMNDFGGK